ncbi:MAG: GSCFA domain-containing protein [Paludibacteraceae bacterium]
MLKLQTPIHIAPSARKISYQDHILLLGSCFADSMAEKMRECYLPLTANPYGTLYNPLSIAQAIGEDEILSDSPEKGKSKKSPSEGDLEGLQQDGMMVYHNGLYHSLLRHGSFSGADAESVRRAVAESRERMAQALTQATVVIITFGTAWVYEYEGRVVANCHKLPASAFTRRRLTPEEIVAAWQPLLQRYKDKHFIFTVSPIRHVKDGLHENQLSKAVLLQAVETLSNSTLKGENKKSPFKGDLEGPSLREGQGGSKSPFKGDLEGPLSVEGQGASVDYFPSYEIVLDELRDYRFYAEDMVHPSPQAVQYVWERFVCTYMSPQTQQDMQTLHRFYQKKHHRILHPDSEESKRFLQQLAEEEQKLKERFTL